MGGSYSERERYEICSRICNQKTEGKEPLGGPSRRWEYSIKMALGETWRDDVDWIHLARDRLQWWAVGNTAMDLLVS
jgi:hypothetical protein